MRRLLLGFGHKPGALVRQQSQGFLETKLLPGPQVMMAMHPRGGIWVARKHSLAAAGLRDLGFSGVLRASWTTQEILLLLRILLMCPVTGLEVASLMLPLPFSYTRGAKIMTGIWLS